MKTILLSIALMIAGISFSQLSTTTTSTVKIFKDPLTNVHLNAYIIDGDTSYTVMYRNMAFKTLIEFESLSFSNKEEVYQLIDLVNTTFEDNSISTTLYSVSKSPYMGKNNSMVFVSSYNYFYANKKVMLDMKEELNNF